MGKRDALQDMRDVPLDIVITLGGRIDLQEVAAGFGSHQHLHGRAADELADGGQGFHLGGELVKVEYPEKGILTRFNRHFRRLPVDGAFCIAGKLSLESKVEVNHAAVFLVVIGAQVTFFHKIDGAAYGAFL